MRLFTPYKRRRKIQPDQQGHQQPTQQQVTVHHTPQQQIQHHTTAQAQIQQHPQEQQTTTINVIAANPVTTNNLSNNNNSSTANNNNITVATVNNNNTITANNNTTNHNQTAKRKKLAGVNILNQIIKCNESTEEIETDNIAFNVKEEAWQNLTEGVDLSNEYVDQQCECLKFYRQFIIISFLFKPFSTIRI